MSHYSFILQSKSRSVKKTNKGQVIFPVALLFLCFFFILMCSTLARGLRRRREYLKCAPWEIWQNKAAAAILANAVLHTKTMLTMLTISTTLTIGAKLLKIGAKLLTILAYGELHNHITSMLPICAIIIRKRVGHH